MQVWIICKICSTSFLVRKSRVAKGAKYCNYKCHQIGEGRKGGVVRGAQIKALENWGGSQPGKEVLTRSSKTYPKRHGRHIHCIVAEEKLGRPLLPGEVVHHLNENKQDFSEGNLQVLPSQAAHARLHIKKVLAIRKPRAIHKFPVTCQQCGKEFFVFKNRIAIAKDCSRLCHNRRIDRG